MTRKLDWIEGAEFGRRRHFQDLSELETRVAAQGFRNTYNKPPVQGLTATGRFPSEPDMQNLPIPDELQEVMNKVLDTQRRHKIVKALMEAAMSVLRQNDAEARVYLDDETDLEIARHGLKVIGRTLLIFSLDSEKESTPDCLELQNGSAIVLRLKAD